MQKWFFNRLKAMSVSEILWRMEQRAIREWEYRLVYPRHLPVYQISVMPPQGKARQRAEADLWIPWKEERAAEEKNSDGIHLFRELKLPGDYSYREYRKAWNAGYQTPAVWPEETFSPEIRIGGREDIGDIRTNWELNRHLQFPCLAKSYYLSGKTEYLQELTLLFEDWNAHNLFLHGAEWTSAMEIAIRDISWIYTAVFLQKADRKTEETEKRHAAGDQRTDKLASEPAAEELQKKLGQGILVMTDYVRRHFSCGSSANNHRILELTALGLGGIYLGREEWTSSAVGKLTRELKRQNFRDGMNREMSVHYQAFVMEAYGLLGLIWKRKKKKLPEGWQDYLGAMSRFLRDCQGNFGESLDFGDNDEGRILDFTGSHADYYQYVLQLMGMILGCRFTDRALCETVRFLTSGQEQVEYASGPLYEPPLFSDYPEGGYTILRSRDGRLLIGFDHGPLGFGALAAHGHADALSIQLFCDGKALLADPGTGSYHVPGTLRKQMRSTENHNTVYVKDTGQAEMQGPFLWGKRYHCLPTNSREKNGKIEICAGIRYGEIVHRRKIVFDFSQKLLVRDHISGRPGSAYQCWVLPAETGEAKEAGLSMKTDAAEVDQVEIPCSFAYNCTGTAVRYMLRLKEDRIRTEFVL